MSNLKEQLLKPDSPDAPWWIRFAYVFGLPGVIAIFLIWFVTSKVDSSLTNIKENLRLHASDSAYQVMQEEKVITLLEQINKKTEQICVNAASTSTERRDCLR